MACGGASSLIPLRMLILYVENGVNSLGSLQSKAQKTHLIFRPNSTLLFHSSQAILAISEDISTNP